MGGQSQLTLHFQPNGILEARQNITIGGLTGSETPVQQQLPLGGVHADAFTSAFFINVTNFSYGPLHNGSIVYRRTASHGQCVT